MHSRYPASRRGKTTGYSELTGSTGHHPAITTTFRRPAHPRVSVPGLLASPFGVLVATLRAWEATVIHGSNVPGRYGRFTGRQTKGRGELAKLGVRVPRARRTQLFFALIDTGLTRSKPALLGLQGGTTE
jgi:hypothetical protein